jgi:hypothetical protein
LKAGYFLVNSDKKVTKETPPRCLRPTIAGRLLGTLRFSAEVGFLDRPSLACLKTLRHPCLARVCARLIHLGL